jgi:TonB family protein
MNTALLLENLLAWALQTSLLVAIVALVSLGWHHARGRLLFWQGVLALILLAPVVVPWHRPAPQSAATGSVAISQGPAVPLATVQSIWSRICNLDSVLWLIGAIALARLIWLGAGLLRLRGLRRRAAPLEIPEIEISPNLSACPLQLAARVYGFAARRADWFSSAEINGPVTFGWLRPCVLLPARVAELPQPLREAIAYHEWIHIERRDWLFVLAEEIIRSLLWFHPAVWFTLSRIQLAREQAVDEAVVQRTSDREGYANALLEVARQSLEPDLMPAPLFLRKRQLAARVLAVMKESRMSKFNSWVRIAAAGCAAWGAVALGAWLFPLQSEAQALPDDSGITCDTGAALLHRPPLRYPPGAKAGGLVVLEATVGTNGQVTDAHVISGPEELRRAALENVLQWHYASDPTPPSAVRVSIQFGPSPSTAERAERSSLRGSLIDNSGGPVSGAAVGLRNTETGALIHTESGADGAFTFSDLPPGPYEVEVSANGFPRRRASMVLNSGNTGIQLRLVSPRAPRPVASEPPPPPPAAPASPSAPAPPPPPAVGGNAQAAKLTTKVAPKYPAEAKAARIQGKVTLSVIIAKDGKVREASVLSGEPILAQAALEAVKQWVWDTTLLNGEPVEVASQIDVNFTLSQ